jgi:hypothetical protein
LAREHFSTFVGRFTHCVYVPRGLSIPYPGEQGNGAQGRRKAEGKRGKGAQGTAHPCVDPRANPGGGADPVSSIQHRERWAAPSLLCASSPFPLFPFSPQPRRSP